MGVVEEALWPVFIPLKILGIYPGGPSWYKYYSIAFLLGNLMTAAYLVPYYIASTRSSYNTIAEFSSALYCTLTTFQQLGNIFFVTFNKEKFGNLSQSVNSLCLILDCKDEVHKKLFKRQLVLFGYVLLMVYSIIFENASYEFDSNLHRIYYWQSYLTFTSILSTDLVLSSFAFSSRVLLDKIIIKIQVID